MNFRSRILSLLTNRSSKSKIVERKNNRRRLQRALFMEGLEQRSLLAAFTPGNLTVVRVGDNSAALTNASTAVFIDEFTPSGTLVQSIALDTSGAGRLTMSGSATSEGALALSADGSALLLAGYDSDTGVSGIASTTAAVAQRSVVVFEADGTYTKQLLGTTLFSGNNIRGASSNDGTDFWAVGAQDGVVYGMFGGGAASSISTGATNLRTIKPFDGSLYVTSGSGTTRLAQVGTGLPTAGSNAIANLTGTPTTGSPYSFFFADLDAGVAGVDTVYVADDGASGGIFKYSLVEGVWVSNGSLSGAAGTVLDDARGLTGSVSGSSVTLFGTSTGTTITATNDTLYTVVDTSGYNATISGTPTVIATTASGNSVFRGVSFAPASSSPEEVDVTGNGVSIADGDTTPDDADHTLFPNTTVGGTPSTRTYTILNTGGTPLTLSAPNSTDPAFVISGFPAGPIPGGSSATFDVVFAPTSATTFTSTISFTNSDSDEGLYDFVVAGEGVSVPVNQPPAFGATGPYSLPENSPVSTEVGTVTATDPDAGQTLTFSEIGTGTGAGLFEIDASGNIVVSFGAVLDFETTAGYTYGVRVTDDGSPNESADVMVTINLSNVNEAPVFPAGSITRTIVQNSANGTAVAEGAVTAIDPDAGGSVASYAITGGNGTGAGAFAIDNNGLLTVNDAAQVTGTGSFALEVTATDNLGLASELKIVAINVIANSPPVFSPDVYNFIINENEPADVNVGDPVTATDPNTGSGDTITFSIVAGNGVVPGAFKINPTTGQIQINDAAQINYEIQSSFALTVQATDSYGAFDTATVNISLFNAPDSPYIPSGQSFTIAENPSNAAIVGTVAATFDSATAPANRRFEFTAGNTGNAFAIGNNGQITVANSAAVDYENLVNHLFALTVRAFDFSNPSFTYSQSVVVNLTNIHEGTLLAPGDVVVTGINADNDDEVSFAVFVDLAPSTEIRFTDKGWLSAGGFRENEGVLVYVAPAEGLPAGSEIGFTKNDATKAVSLTHGVGRIFDETGTDFFALSNSGDSIIAFQGVLDAPTPLYAVSLSQDVFDDEASDSNTTSLPTGLTVGTTAVAVGFTGAGNETDNAEYSGTTFGGPAALLAAVGDAANWTKSNSRISFTYQDFVFNSAPTAIGLSHNTLVEGEPIGSMIGTFSTIDPDLADTHTYTLVSGDGSEDNASFTIDGNLLKSAEVFDFEVKDSYTIRVRTTDAGGLFAEQALTISISDVRIVIPATLTAASYKEDAVPVLVGGVFSVADVEQLDFDGGTLTAWFSGNGTADDRLSVKSTPVAANKVTVVGNEIYFTKLISGVLETYVIGAFAGGDGLTPLVVTFNSNAFKVEVQATLKAIAFDNTSNNPAVDPREVSLIVTDGNGGVSNTASRTVNVIPVNDAPELVTLGQVVNYTENDSPVIVDSGLTITDEDSIDFDTGKLTVKILGGQTSDLLSIDVTSGPFTINDITKEVSHNGSLIGVYAGTSTFTVTFNSLASPAIVQELARRIAFSNASDAVMASTRSISFTVTDGDKGTSLAAALDSVNVAALNDVPMLTGITGLPPAKFTENGAAVAIASSGVVVDLDLWDFDGGALTASLGETGDLADQLALKSELAPTKSKINVVGNAIFYSKLIGEVLTNYQIGTFAGGEGGVDLVIDFNSAATKTEVQTVLKAITFSNNSENPVTTQRLVSFVLTDGDGGESEPATRLVDVIAKNDLPSVANFGGDVNWMLNSSTGTFLTDSVEIGDVDSGDFQGGRLIVALTTNKQSADRIEIVEGDGITVDTINKTVSYNGALLGTYAGTTKLTVTFTTTSADAAATEALLKRITFKSTSASTLSRTVSVTVNDGDLGTSAAVTKQINVTSP
jgi:hypothetical protein